MNDIERLRTKFELKMAKDMLELEHVSYKSAKNMNRSLFWIGGVTIVVGSWLIHKSGNLDIFDVLCISAAVTMFMDTFSDNVRLNSDHKFNVMKLENKISRLKEVLGDEE